MAGDLKPDAVRRALTPFGRLFDFEGRTRRADYWPYILLLLAIWVAGFVFTMLAMGAGLGLSIAPGYAVTALVALFAFAATVRRMHDVGWSGYWVGAYLALLIAFVASFFVWRFVMVPQAEIGQPTPLFRFFPLLVIASLMMQCLGLLILVITVLEGARGSNRYGPDPKAESAP